MKRAHMNRGWWLFAVAAALAIAGDAGAIIGRPLTPVSFAGAA